MDSKVIDKKIFFLSPSLRKGGAENQLTKIATYLSKANDVEIITFIEGNDFSELLKIHNVSLKVFNTKSVSGFFKLINYVSKNKPNILICFMFSANIIGRFIKLFTKTPIITSVRANVMSSVYKLFYKFTYKLDDYSTFNSNFALEEFCQNQWAVLSKSMVINNAIEIDKIKGEDNIYNNFSSEIKLISIAHFRPSKDYRTLFKAVKIVKQKGYNIKLNVLGNIDNQTWPFEMLKELSIEENVNILGFTQKTKEYIDQSNFLILSSFLEGTPNALLEAMSRKKPVIASDIPGNDFVVNESKGGFLFKLEDEIDLADKIVDMIALSENQRKELGNNGFNFVLENYEINTILKKWERLIDTIVRNER